MLGKIKAMLMFSREVRWVDEPTWKEEDAKKLENFLASDTGRKFGKVMLNMIIKTQSSCLEDKKDLVHSVGFANGFKGAVSAIESLANTELYENSDEGAPSDLEM